MRQLLQRHSVFVHTVVQACNVHDLCETGFQRVVYAVHALSHSACGVKAVAQVLKPPRSLGSASHALFGNLIANAPHYYGGVVAVAENEIRYVFLCPFVEEARITVFAFWIFPHIEAFCHDHHSERIAYVHLHCGWHVVGCAYCVAAHSLHHFYLADERGLVYGGPEWAEVMVQAHALDFACLAVQLESSVLGHAYCAYAEVYCLLVGNVGAFMQQCGQFVEVWRLRRPQFRILHFQLCLHSTVVADAASLGCHHAAVGIGKRHLNLGLVSRRHTVHFGVYIN